MNKEYIYNRLKEPSTWRGIVVFLTGVGFNLSPEMSEQIVIVAVPLVGLLGMISKG